MSGFSKPVLFIRRDGEVRALGEGITGIRARFNGWLRVEATPELAADPGAAYVARDLVRYLLLEPAR
jgi:hypothetical protein